MEQAVNNLKPKAPIEIKKNPKNNNLKKGGLRFYPYARSFDSTGEDSSIGRIEFGWSFQD